MNINQELIERYHRDECTEAERKAVEEWLFSDDSADELDLPVGEEKAAHKASIWNEIAPALPNQNVTKNHSLSFWKGVVAASLVFGVLGFGFYQFKLKNDSPQSVSVDNTSAINVRHLDSKGYNISVGPNTFAKINYATGSVDLSGSMLISPKKDVELKFKGSDKKIHLKMGQTYIILNGKTDGDKIIVVSERNLMDLPPVLQKQIINQFSI
ncbi:hypothetical protein CPT03_19280 [Pedobacter ginsengisoli]|uniref:Uncharacterized protein n=1 Tax=Pedobacter ginsengisoli TaxID=363852 RepID=A0A2D1UA67_9SPHI|nr:hypothetical protein [Pedobacter ginsengisoli]ATP58451.1 hypothetical protein CPT03_19280 [Pedobacter ginsengisoli]